MNNNGGSDEQKRMIKENVWLFFEEGTSWRISPPNFIDERIKRKKSEEIIRMVKLEVDRIEIELSPLYNVNLISEESKRYLYVSPN